MHRALPALLLLVFAASAPAQVIVGDEILSDPLRPRLAPALPLAVPAVSLAKDRSGIAIAWTMANSSGADRVYVARLDDNGHVAGSVHEMPPATAAAQTHEVYPSIDAAPDGNGFVAAWLEIDPYAPMTARAVFARLDAALMPLAPAVLFPAPLTTTPAIVRTSNAKTWISAGGFVWTMDADGALNGPFGGLLFASDMTIAGGVPHLAGSHAVKSDSYTCQPGCVVVGGPFRGFCPDQCHIYHTDTEIDFSAPPAVTVAKTFKFVSDAQPALAGNGSDVVVVWFRGAQADGGDVVFTRMPPSSSTGLDAGTPLTSFPGDTGPTRPDIAVDGARYVVTWRVRTSAGNHDVAGAVIDADDRLTPLTIATTAADERDPAILALGGGTFLVAYETISGTERRIAGRFITFGRRRATR
ncbi:MAG TPA: hypothetical protein VJZ76_19590 [Thermoanaerobaculia bacterium]|nr:hypothetical protein [Thermoanaerobaculia bacterium]